MSTVVHVMGDNDAPLEHDEYRCSYQHSWKGALRSGVAVVYHPESLVLGDSYCCTVCGESPVAKGEHPT